MRAPDDADDLAAEAVPIAQKNPVEVSLSSIPLPPADLVDQLDNDRAADTGVGAEEPDEAVTLEFCGDELPERTFPLRFPFKWEGVRHDAVTVRQLSVAEVGRLVSRQGGRSIAHMDIYAEMTGLPAKVLRALPAADGDPIIEGCFDFLPPFFRAPAG